MKKVVVLAGVILMGCAPHRYMYKVTFGDDTYEYFELNYKPQTDAKAIEYDGEVIMGVEKIERIK